MKISTEWLDQLFNFLNEFGKMLLYLYQFVRGKL